MNPARMNQILDLANAGMILCWFDVLNSLVMPGFSRPPLPVSLAAAILAWSAFAAFCIGSCHLVKGLTLLLHITAFLVPLALVLTVCGNPAYPFYDFDWVIHPPSVVRAVWQWLEFIVNCAFTGLLYILGSRFGRVRPDANVVANRMDLGISVFFVLLIVKLIFAHKGATIPYPHTLGRQLVCFMILGLFSLGVARNRTSHRNSTVSYYKGAGMVLSFGMAAAVFGTGMVMLFLPDLTRGAFWGKEMLGRTWPAIEQGATFIANSKWMSHYFTAYMRVYEKYAGTAGPGWTFWDGSINPVHTKSVITIGILHSLVVLWFFAEWLFQKPEKNRSRPGLWTVLRRMAERVRRIVLFFIRLVSTRRTPFRRVEQYWGHFKRFGARSGLPLARHETPNEYGIRLAGHFPQLDGDIRYLVDLFNRVKYGGLPVGKDLFARLATGKKQMGSPKLWPLRARIWLFQARM